MTQFARPASTISNPGPDWARVSDFSTTNIWQYVDEASPNDTDADSILDTQGVLSVLELKLGAVTDPVSSTGHVLTVRMRHQNINRSASVMNVGIKCGATTIKATAGILTGTITSTAADFTYTLTGTEADAITDYSDIRITFKDTAQAGDVIVTQAYLSVPDALVTVSTTRRVPYVVKTAVSTTRRIVYGVSGPVSTTRRIVYGIAGITSTTRRVPYTVLNPVSTTRRIPFNVTGLAATTRRLLWQTFAGTTFTLTDDFISRAGAISVAYGQPLKEFRFDGLTVFTTNDQELIAALRLLAAENTGAVIEGLTS